MLVVAQEYATNIYRVSFLSLLPAYLSFHYQKYDIMLVPLTVFATSINYWRKPTYGWRRNVDIVAVCGSVFFQLSRILDCENKHIVLTFMCSGTCSYIMARCFSTQPSLSTANLALVFLILGS